MNKLCQVLKCREHLCVLARTDASGDEVYQRIAAFSQTDADVLLVDGIRSLETLREVRKLTDKPILFNQIAGGKSPRVSLSEIRATGAALALYSTPCLFAAQSAIDDALTEIFGKDGLLPDTSQGRAVGVASCTSLLQNNIR